MPLLHIHLNSPKTTVELGHDLKPQNLILRKVIVHRINGTAFSENDSGIHIDLHRMFNGFEMLSNKSQDNKLYVPVPNFNITTFYDYAFHVRFNSEEIHRSFEVQLTKKDGSAVVFGSNANNYVAVDLYFEYETAQHFETVHNPSGKGSVHSTI
jgi:hypothetical protein